MQSSSSLVSPKDASAHEGAPARQLLTPADIREFQRLVLESRGMRIDEVEAWNRATVLVALYRMMLRPLLEDPDFASSNIGALPSFEPGKLS